MNDTVPSRFPGKIIHVTESGTTIEMSDGTVDNVDTEAWRLTHGEPEIGSEVEKVFELKENEFGIHCYGFVPKGFKVEGWS